MSTGRSKNAEYRATKAAPASHIWCAVKWAVVEIEFVMEEEDQQAAAATLR
jgi:hypothetical protein